MVRWWLSLMLSACALILLVLSLSDAQDFDIDQKCTAEEDWFTIGSSSYRLISPSIYSVQVTRCERMDASLFVPNSKEEYEAVVRVLKEENVSTEFYIGLAILSADCAPRWQMNDGMDIEELPWLNNPHSYHLRSDLQVPVSLLNSSTSSLRFVHHGHPSPAICERNSSLSLSSHPLSFSFWRSSLSRHLNSSSDVVPAEVDLPRLCRFFDECRRTARWTTVEHKAYQLSLLDPELFQLAGLEDRPDLSGPLTLSDWFYNLQLLTRNVIPEDSEMEFCRRKLDLDLQP